MILNSDSEEIRSLLLKNFSEIAERPLQEEIVQVGRLMSYRAGEVIMEIGSYVRMVPLVVKGSVKVVREDPDGREIFLYYLQAGEACSMSFTCCMMNKQSVIRTEAVEDTTIIGIPIQYVDRWMSQYQSWKNFIMTSYDNRLLEMVKVIDNTTYIKAVSHETVRA